MTPRRRKPKGSSPRNKVKKVLARWSDGLFYIIKILKVSEIKKRCLVEFEDQSTAYVHFKDLLDERKEESKSCHNCGGNEELENNAFIRCTNCDREFHRHCHVPPIISDPMAKQFVCRICVFAACAKAGGAKETGPMAARFMFMKREFPYDLEHLSWNPSHTSNTSECYCYCGGTGNFFNKMLQCCRCHQWFHEACVQCIRGELLMGDRFYIFSCAHCNYGEEFLKRLDLSWQNIVYISIFHLCMTQSLKYTDLDLDIIPFIKAQADSFGLCKLFNTQDIDSEILHRKVLDVVLSHTEIYCCGAEVKKKQSLLGLRERIPPPPPSFYIPHKAEKISNLTLSNSLGKRALFKPPKYVNTLPYLIRGANKFIPSTMSLKLREVSMARLVSKSEHNYCSTSDEYSSSSDRDSIVSKENYDANNNNSPFKQSLLPDIKKEPSLEQGRSFSRKKFVPKEMCASSGDDSEEDNDLVRGGGCPISFDDEMVKGESSAAERGTKFWSLETAFPEPRDFSGVNNPFLTDIEQADLKAQRNHFLKQLEHLSLSLDNYTSAKSESSPSPCETPPVSVPSSPLLTNIKGFKGELSKIFKTNGYSSSSTSPSSLSSTRSSFKSRDNSRSVSCNGKKMSPEKAFGKSCSSPKTRRSDCISTPSISSSQGSNGEWHEKNQDDSNIPHDLINGVRLSPQIAARFQRKNGVKRSQRLSNSLDAMEEEKRLKAVSRCLKNLTPTCGFHFPVLDENHPSVVNGVEGMDGDLNDDSKTPGDLGRRGLKRKHSSHSKNESKQSRFVDSIASDECGGENVRRSHRSRQTVKRFETRDMSVSKLDLMNPDVQMNSSILNMAKYNVISLRLRHDNTVDYLIDWCDE